MTQISRLPKPPNTAKTRRERMVAPRRESSQLHEYPTLVDVGGIPGKHAPRATSPWRLADRKRLTSVRASTKVALIPAGIAKQPGAPCYSKQSPRQRIGVIWLQNDILPFGLTLGVSTKEESYDQNEHGDA